MFGFKLSTLVLVAAALLAWYLWRERKKPLFPSLVYSSVDPGQVSSIPSATLEIVRPT